MSVSRFSLLILCAGLATGCKHVVPDELADARYAYEHARLGPAAEVVPAELHKAEVALATAEQAFLDDPKGYHTRDLAYVAHRTAQRADALARTDLQEQRTERADDAFVATQAQIVDETRADLAASEAAGAQTSADLAASEAAGAQTTAALATSEAARREADLRTAAALAELASVKEEQRGLVITLSGSVLFRSGEATLLPEAMTRLDQVTAALLTTKDRTLVVEGHTDADGDDASNVDLSQRRAEAVRAYIVSRGYDSARILAHGIGEARPLADNTSPEGKANNRRVEIVVSR